MSNNQNKKNPITEEIMKEIPSSFSEYISSPEYEKPQQASFYNPEKQIDRIWGLMLGLLAFVVISFLGTLFILICDQIKEKDLYLEYNKFYKEYSEKNIQLNNAVNQNLIEVNNLNNEIRMLKAKNPYLK